ncbi:MAG: hypothetical protein LQ337_008352 [Flavoplaca oasis]|nr:MAG: hypothetical protein LQ337_008352 [Flavoplaca oasis]
MSAAAWMENASAGPLAAKTSASKAWEIDPPRSSTGCLRGVFSARAKYSCSPAEVERIVLADIVGKGENGNIMTKTAHEFLPAPPFPELYALLHLDTSAFIHIKYVWSPLTPLQIHTYHILARNLQTSLANTIRGHGDIKLPDKGVAKELERLEYRIYPVPSRRYEVRYSVVQAAIRGVAALFRIYGFYEVEVGIHMFEYVEDRPDGYMVLIIDEDSPSREVSRI